MPDLNELNKTLHAFETLSQALLDCELSDMERLQALLDERQALLARIEADWPEAQTATASAPEQLSGWLQRIRELDQRIEQRFTAVYQQQSTDLKNSARAREALAHYRFPRLSSPSSLENEG